MSQTQSSMTRRGGNRVISPDDIDADYERKGVALGSEDPRKMAYFGVDEVGPIGKAMALHRRLWLDNRAMTAHAFGLKLEAAISSSIPDNAVPSNLDADHLRAWVQASRPVALPDPDYANVVLAALQDVAREAQLDEKLVAALAESWQRPSQLLTLLRDVPDVGWGAHFHPIDQVFLARSEPEVRYEATARLIGDAFVGDLGKSHILMVASPLYSGKRRAITSMIQSRRIKDSHFIDIPGQGPLPLFARNVEGLTIERVIWDVAEFLRLETPDGNDPASIDRLIEQIAEACRQHEFAAAFILARIPAPGGLLNRLLGRERLIRLISALSPAGGQTRLLLTGEDAQWIHVERPVYSIPISEIPRVHEIIRKYSLSVTGTNHDIAVDGVLLTLLDTLLAKSWERSDDLYDVARSCAAQAIEIFEATDAGKVQITDRRELSIIADEILNQLGPIPEALDTLLYISLCEDGLRASSLAALRQNQTLEQGEDSNNVNRQFDGDVLALNTNLRLICRLIECAGPWPGENPPEYDDATRLESTIELLPPFRMIFEAAFARRDNDDFRRKNWAIARLARQQSRWKRLSPIPEGTRGDFPFGLIREAQALRRAQIGLDPSVRVAQSSTAACSMVAHSAMERLVLSGKDISFDESYRFLYYDIFVDDIDSRHRLSVHYDQDDLKLTLLLGFCNPGVPVYVDNNGSEYVERANWRLVSELLPRSGLSELLISIAVAANRVGAWSIVKSIARKSQYLADRDLTTLDAIERVFRSYIDSQILRCGAAGAISKLSDVRNNINNMIDRYSKLKSWKAQVKLHTRLGEVNHLTGDFGLALAAFEDAERNACKAAVSDSDVDREWDRSPILGHGARRYLRLICDISYREINDATKKRLLEKAEDLYCANTRRLARFPSERPLLILDKAMIANSLGYFDQSYYLVQKVPEYNSVGLMSLSDRLDFETTLARLCLDLLRLTRSDSTERRIWLTARSKAAIDSVLQMAETSELPVFQSFGEMFAARWLELVPPNRREQTGAVFGGRTPAELIETASFKLKNVGCKIFDDGQTYTETIGSSG